MKYITYINSGKKSIGCILNDSLDIIDIPSASQFALPSNMIDFLDDFDSLGYIKSDINQIKFNNVIKDFDDIYTSKAHGFKNAYDYYQKNNSKQFLPTIKIPVLILNAKNDSFLSTDCFPFENAELSKFIYLETPQFGGHVGFHYTNETYYSEKRTVTFLNEKL